MMDLYDVTIIGAGPAGLYSTFYAGARQLKVKCIEAAPIVGGRLALYPHVTVQKNEQQAVSGKQFLTDLTEQAHTFSPTFCLNEWVVAIEEESDCLCIHTTKGKHYTKTAVLATGNGYLQPKKLAKFPLSLQLEPYFTYTIDEVSSLMNRHIIVYGNTNVTAEWALQIQPYAKHVTVMTEESNWQIDAPYLQQLREKNIDAFCDVQYRDCEMIDGQMHCYFNASHVIVDQIVIQPGFESRALSEQAINIANEAIPRLYTIGCAEQAGCESSRLSEEAMTLMDRIRDELPKYATSYYIET